MAILKQTEKEALFKKGLRCCPSCKVTKRLDEFFKSKATTTGIGIYCKACCAQRDRQPRMRYSQVRCLAKRRNIPWNITLDEYVRLIAKPCFYCSGPLSETGANVDRIDNTKGYESVNLVPCCPLCNWMRQDAFTFNEMLELGETVRKLREKRGPNGAPFLLPGQWKSKRMQE